MRRDILLIVLTLVNVGSFHEEKPDILLCRQCGADVGHSKHIFNVYSPSGTVLRNQTWFGKKFVDVHIFENPLGIKFRVVTLAKAECVGINEWQREYTWFPGYAWKNCMCSHYGHHLGWMYEPLATANNRQAFPSSEGFYALIVDDIISESFADSLILPKSSW
ncbi:uncharacterized protein LOC124595617 isoform X2 [Schistocerca americana]|uniref:uncharacterized protein LOC124595617 isoform X2 n=1 Tax=Schistocerca americana TaxID=7009 RepID=UPI001F5011A8|nr:uncharacterized protein LOC124595617 isoform X2 [Schistocerca americana]XP_049949374.1 uncharacterized protein LOC126457256 isoform X1 [Schistocerca serialis cubense]